MDLRKLKMVHDEEVPLYSLPSGTRYQYTDLRKDEQIYIFIKHPEYEFPAHYRINRKNIVSYQYSIAISDTHASLIIFVDETAIVKPLIFK